MRNFSQRILNIAPAWREQVLTNDVWEKHEKGSLNSAERPFWVASKDYMAVAKPGLNNPRQALVPVAAQEKIASDLAYELGLPVPPVVLWDRGKVPDKEAQHVAISVVPFGQPREWNQILKNPQMLERVREVLSPIASCMHVFDTWVQNEDHNNHPGNLLIGLSNPTQVAYIDYGHSMGHKWVGSGSDNNFVAPMYNNGLKRHNDKIIECINNIKSLKSATICNIVNRIPVEFISIKNKMTICEGLTGRQKQLDDLLKVEPLPTTKSVKL